jgi:nucleoside 2-deoxyribosyltransferase
MELVRKYLDPQVNLVEGTSTDLSYYIWLKSRQWVVSEDRKGTKKFMLNSEFSDTWYRTIPNEFYVGDEKVTNSDYRARIDRMNLQYNNFDQYVFEIQGSCLFRDILYNINKVAQWAQSNRFLFSILDENERFNSLNYAISSEYKDIPEWESQFDRYMEAIKEDPIVDHNRLEMPYSISSTFWISINKKTLIDLLGFLYHYAPFFYEIYGSQFERILGLVGYKYSDTLSADISQYISKDYRVENSMYEVGGTIIMSLDMAFILYSQFIRQADTLTAGLYNIIIHRNSEKFKHKVFKGGTVFRIHYVADKDKVESTIKTRLCAFAMSSGSGPDSWNNFISNYLKLNGNPKEFMKLLPCTFKDNRLVHCKFRDDIKFRNEGKEISNCPCPLVTLSMSDALTKKDRDKNIIGDSYYELTRYLITDGLMHQCEHEYWTSSLRIYTVDDSYSFEIIDSILTDLGTQYKKCEVLELEDYSEYFLPADCTCAMKGLAIDKIARYLISLGHNRFLIDFGGDIFSYNTRLPIKIEGTRYSINLPRGKWSVFTSGNNLIRGKHIEGNDMYGSSVVIVKQPEIGEFNNIEVDILATKYYAKDWNSIMSLDKIFYAFDFDSSGRLINKVYIASPFFDEVQVAIRDNMASNFISYFRPDLTEESDNYEVNPCIDSAIKVVDANIEGITESEFLVFPKHTSDLGTLFEVGVAIAQNKPVIAYNEKSDSYEINILDMDIATPESGNYLFDCSKKSDVVSMGYLSEKLPNTNIKYMLNGAKDNIMLSIKYEHVEYIDGKLTKIDRNERIKDREI